MTTLAVTEKRRSWGCGMLWGVFVALLPGIFVGFMLAVTIDPVGDALATALHCPGAVSASRDEASGGTIRSNGRNVSTKVVDIICYMPDGSTKTIENDPLALTKMFGGAAAGALVEIVLIAVWWVQSRLRRLIAH